MFEKRCSFIKIFDVKINTKQFMNNMKANLFLNLNKVLNYSRSLCVYETRVTYSRTWYHVLIRKIKIFSV